VKAVERDLMWQAARRFGQRAWDDNAAGKRDRKPRIIPAADMNSPALVAWPEYQAQLMVKRIRPSAAAPTSRN